ncbi:MAG TPA: hypothetical protein ENI26_14145 [Methylophaga aminisulfidivorans]|uniref:Uncharacterized protein n=1 Tax=Methylophaga aminisulfidivorans TaxID=230105 RepID=A0A7C1ZT72_9GAMM|nr:hypothetical protein [Methylophaga aminisulfidivorans]
MSNARYQLLKAENEKKISDLQEEKDSLRQQMNQANVRIAGFEAQIGVLAIRINSLTNEMNRVQREADARIAAVQDLTLNQVALQTLDQLDLVAPAIRATGDDFLVFKPDAAKRNLRQLIAGTSALNRIEIALETILQLERKSEIKDNIITDKDLIIGKKDAEIGTITKQHVLALEIKDAEIKAVKSKARKRGAIATVVGFIGGLLAKGLFL